MIWGYHYFWKHPYIIPWKLTWLAGKSHPWMKNRKYIDSFMGGDFPKNVMLVFLGGCITKEMVQSKKIIMNFQVWRKAESRSPGWSTGFPASTVSTLRRRVARWGEARQQPVSKPLKNGHLERKLLEVDYSNVIYRGNPNVRTEVTTTYRHCPRSRKEIGNTVLFERLAWKSCVLSLHWLKIDQKGPGVTAMLFAWEFESCHT